MNRKTFFKEYILAAAKIVGCGYDELVDALTKTAFGGFKIASLEMEQFRRAPIGGVRCRYSEQGKSALSPRHPDRRGWLLGKKRKEPEMLRVQWDGMVAIQFLHRDFIKIENSH